MFGPRTIAAATLAGCLALAAGAVGAPSPSGPWVVADLGDRRAEVAGHRTDRGPQTLAQLIRVWGPPSSVRAAGPPSACTAGWRVPDVSVSLANYALAGRSACTPSVGKIDVITTRGQKWRTNRGVGVGASTRALRAAYPDSTVRRWGGIGRVWLLEPTETTCLGDCGGDLTVEVAGVLAKERSGRIVSFSAVVAAAGE